jgi:hypothetical protein
MAITRTAINGGDSFLARRFLRRGGGTIRSLLWWISATVLVLMILNNTVQRRRRVDRLLTVDRPPSTDASSGGVPNFQPTDPVTVDPEHIGAGPDALDDAGRDLARRDQRSTRRRRATPPAPVVESPAAEFLQREILGHFARREALRPKRNTACFLSLVRHTPEGLSRFVRLMTNVKSVMPGMAAKYPFVGFVEASAKLDVVSHELEKLSGFSPGTKVGGDVPLMHVFPAGVHVVHVSEEDFGMVPSFVPPQHLWPYGPHNYWGVPYRHMCRFFGVRVMFQPILAQFDYYMRLDTDSFLLSPPRSTVVAPTRRMLWDASNDYPVGGEGMYEWIHRARAPDKYLGGGPAKDVGATDAEEVDEVPSTPLPTAAASRDLQGALHRLGLEEVEVEVDLFHEMAVRGAVYGFDMIHPQPTSEFVSGLFEAYDAFVRKEMDDYHLPVGDAALPFRNGGRGDGDKAHGGGPTPFKAPRGLALHFWDNFEIVDLRVYRRESYLPRSGVGSRDPAAPMDSSAEAKGEESAEHQAAIELHSQRALSVERFLRAMDYASGFYTRRWGDAEVRTLTMTLYLDQERFLFINSLGYQHYHNYHCPALGALDVIGTGDGKTSNNAADEARRLADKVGEVSEAAAAERLYTQMKSMFLSAFSVPPDTPSRFNQRETAVDSVLRQLSPSRHRLEASQRDQCMDGARQNFGHGSKGVGTAPMNPAELPPNNRFFWQQAWQVA